MSFILKNKSAIPTPDTGYTGVYTNAGDLYIKDETGAVTQITSGGTVTSVDVTSSTLSVSGGPITSAGTFTINADIDTLVPSQTGNSGKVLSTDGTSVSWVTPASAGTVTSVGISGSNGISVSGSPITSSGTIDLSLTDIDVTNVTVYSGTDYANSNYLRLDSTGSGAELISSKTGTGITKPFVFKMDSTEIGRVSTAGQWVLGTGTGSGLIPGSNLEIRNADTNSSMLGALSHTSTTNGSSNLVLARARGVTGTPSAVLTGDRLGGIFFKGYGTSYDNNAAYIAAYAAQDWSGTERGGKLGFGVTTFGGTTTAELFTLNSTGPHRLIGSLDITDTLQVHSGLSAGTEGTLSWNDGDGTLDLILKGSQVTLQLGQEQVIRINNNTGSGLTDGQVVYVTGSQGQRMTVALADNSAESTSSGTIGVVTEPIANGADGFVTTFGLVRNLNTSAFTEGAALYLGTGGGLTQTKPVAPNHMVLVGYCIRSHASSGSIFVKVQNGYELDELHDVLLDTPGTGDILTYDGAKWVNSPVPEELPDQSGNSGKVLGTDGTSVSWVSPSTWLAPVVTAQTSSSSSTVDFTGTDVIRLTLDSSPTLTFTGAVSGQKCILELIQDGTGNRTVTLPGNVRFGTDITGITLSTAAGKTDRLGLIFSAANTYDVIAFAKGY